MVLTKAPQGGGEFARQRQLNIAARVAQNGRARPIGGQHEQCGRPLQILAPEIDIELTELIPINPEAA